jgi:membrane-associated protein
VYQTSHKRPVEAAHQTGDRLVEHMNGLLPYLLNWFLEYGYPVLWLSIFIGALGLPLPNTLMLLAAGAFAAFGDFNFGFLIVISMSAFVGGDSLSYWIGRLWGSRLLAWLEAEHRVRFLPGPRNIAHSRVYFHRLGGWAIFLSRFLVSVLGGAINLLAGAEVYPYRRFIVYDIFGEALGALIPLTLGYIFGTSWEEIGDLLGSFSLLILALLIVLYLSYRAMRIVRRMHKRRKARGLQNQDGQVNIPAISSHLPDSDRASSVTEHLPL